MKLTRILRAAALALVAFVPLIAQAGEVRQISQILDSGGKPVVNGYIYVGTYGADPVTNPITLYSDPGLTVPITNPQRTDSYGRPVNDIYFVESQYAYTLKDANSVTLEGPRNRYSVQTTQAGSQSGVATWAGTAGGTANAITLNLTPTLTAYSDGMTVRFRVNSANTLAVTVNIDGNGAKNLTKEGGTALAANDLLANQAVVIVYNSTQNRFEVVSADHALSRTGGTVSGTLSMSAAAINNAIRVDVASVAGTVNLDTAASNSIRITGALAITGFTLTDGRFRHVLAGGAFTITTSASLVVTGYPSGATITFASGDTFDVYGESAGVVRVTNPVLAVGSPRILAAGGNITVPADATEDTLVTATLPANALGANGMLRITTSWTCTNNANAKTARIKFGGIAIVADDFVSTGGGLLHAFLSNKNATNAQFTNHFTISVANALINGGGTNATAIDSTAAVPVLITGQKAVAGDTMTLNHYTIELLPSP